MDFKTVLTQWRVTLATRADQAEKRGFMDVAQTIRDVVKELDELFFEDK